MKFISILNNNFALAALCAITLTSCGSHNEDKTASALPPNASLASLVTAAERGNPDAQFALGVKYQIGDGVKVDPKKAAEWYEKAANAGHIGAMSNLAALYYDGNGVEKDFSKALELYKKAATEGDIGAYASLAGMYLDGKGVPQDYSEARKLYMYAATRNYASAQNAIGVMFKFGWGVQQNNVEAYAWWILATSNGDGVAPDNMREIRNQLSESDIAHAQLRSKELAKLKPSSL